MRHTHKEEMELWTCVCTSIHFCQLFTDHWRGRTPFLFSEIIILFYFILFYFILFYFILFYFNLFYFISYYVILYYFIFSFLVVFVLYDFTISLVVFHLYNELRHTHKQEMELQTCVCTSFYFHHLFTNPCWGRTCFFLNDFILLDLFNLI